MEFFEHHTGLKTFPSMHEDAYPTSIITNGEIKQYTPIYSPYNYQDEDDRKKTSLCPLFLSYCPVWTLAVIEYRPLLKEHERTAVQ